MDKMTVKTYTAFIREDGLYDMYFGRHDARPMQSGFEVGYSGTVTEAELGEIAMEYHVHFPKGFERTFPGEARVLA